MGAACPFDRTKRSLSGFPGFFGSNRISQKNSTDMMSAADRHVVGWPLPAWLVEATESIRSWVAMSCSAATEDAAIVFSALALEGALSAGCKRAVYHWPAALTASTYSAASGPSPAARGPMAESVR